MSLAEPNFVDRDPSQITADLVAAFEAATKRTLYPAQAERLMVNVIAYRETLVRQALQEAAKQNLVAFARAPMLDYLGQLVGVTRLPASSATTTLRFTLATSAATDTLISAGTRVQSSDGRLIFATDANATLAAGALAIDVMATCALAGSIGNGWAPGQLATLVDDPGNGLFASVLNVTQSANGLDEELDDRLRSRIMLAPEAYSNAGSREAYRFFALSASQVVSDVAVLSLTPGTVNLYPLAVSGLPDANLLALVLAACNGEKRRPLCDSVVALAPTPSPFTINAQLVIYSSADQATVLAAANDAANAYAASVASQLGQDIVPSQIIAALSVAGVYSVTLTAPTVITVADPQSWAHCTGITIAVTGVKNG